MRYLHCALRPSVVRPLVLGLLITVFAIVAGWVLVSPAMVTDKATQEWYSQ